MSDNVTDMTPHILREIRDELIKHGAQLDALREGQTQTNKRLDSLIESGGASNRAQSERLASLEGRVERLERSVRRRRPSPGKR